MEDRDRIFLPMLPTRFTPMLREYVYRYPRATRDVPFYDIRGSIDNIHIPTPEGDWANFHCHYCGWPGHNKLDHTKSQFTLMAFVVRAVKAQVTRFFPFALPEYITRHTKVLFHLALQVIRLCLEVNGTDSSGRYQHPDRSDWTYEQFANKFQGREFRHPAEAYSNVALIIAQYNALVDVVVKTNPNVFEAVGLEQDSMVGLLFEDTRPVVLKARFDSEKESKRIEREHMNPDFFAAFQCFPGLTPTDFQVILQHDHYVFALPALTPSHDLWESLPGLRVLYDALRTHGHGVDPDLLAEIVDLSNTEYPVNAPTEPALLSFISSGLPAMFKDCEDRLALIMRMDPHKLPSCIQEPGYHRIFDKPYLATLRDQRQAVIPTGDNSKKRKRGSDEPVWTTKRKNCGKCGIPGHRDSNCEMLSISTIASWVGNKVIMPNISTHQGLFHFAFDLLDLYQLVIITRIMELEVKKMEELHQQLAQKVVKKVEKIITQPFKTNHPQKYDTIMEAVQDVSQGPENLHGALASSGLDSLTTQSVIDVVNKLGGKMREVKDQQVWRRNNTTLRHPTNPTKDLKGIGKNSGTYLLALYMTLRKHLQDSNHPHILFESFPGAVKYPRGAVFESTIQTAPIVSDLRENFFSDLRHEDKFQRPDPKELLQKDIFFDS